MNDIRMIEILVKCDKYNLDEIDNELNKQW